MYEVKVTFHGAEKIMQDKGLDPGGKIQRLFSSEVMRISDPYLPRDDAGVLQSSACVADSGDAVIYSTPYARYHWFGKLMVDPITGKGAFHDPSSGRFWSRPRIDKVLTDRDMKYQGAPMRGPRWVSRAWLDHGESVLFGIEKLINGGQK